MIGTGEFAGIAAPVNQPHHPVTTDIRMGLYRAVAPAEDDHRLTAMLKRHVITNVRQLVGTPRTQPASRKDAFFFLGKNFGQYIHRLGHGRCARHRTFGNRL